MRLHTLASVAGLFLFAPLFAQAPQPTPVDAGLTFEQANERAHDPRWLSLKYAEFDTTGPEPAMAPDLTAGPVAPGALGAWIVQLTGPITEAKQDALAATGARVLDYVPNLAFTVRATPEQLAAVRALPDVVWTGSYHPAYRLDARLREASEDPAAAQLERRIVVHAFAGASRFEIEAGLAESGLAVSESHPLEDRWLLVATGSAAAARSAARLAGVHWIEPEGELGPRNNTTAWVVQTFQSNNFKVWNNGIHGENQIVGHIDGSIRTTSCYFQDTVNPIGPNHRKIVFHSGGGSDSHGTHTAGTVAGDAQPINGSTSNRGIAWAARLAHTTGFPFSTFNSVATNHHNVGARMHTNSWGDDGTTSYNTICNQIDLFQWNNEDDLVMFAATNTSSLKNPENAKNQLAVEASSNGFGANSKCSGGVGPTADGRRKPEIFAPGCSIVSAGTGTCSTGSLSGTSMACPAVAAAGSLVRQYFQEGFYPTGAKVPANGFDPTGALVKAVLVNTSQDMTGIGGYPSNAEGWGRLNLDESLLFTGDTSNLLVDDVRRANGLTTGQTVEHVINVTSTSTPLEITLAFTDFPGNVGASNPVVNNLDLFVIAPNGAQYRGNVMANGTSNTGGSADAKNNVERVAFPTPLAGPYTVRVIATNVVQGPSGYGLVASGEFQLCNPAVTVYCTGKPGLTCGTPFMGTFGLPSASATNGFFLIAGPARANKTGLLIYSNTGANNAPFLGGTLCINPPVRRTPVVGSGGFSTCDGEFAIDMNAFASGAMGGSPQAFLTVIGTQVNTQFWGRDSLATGSFLSDGVQYNVCD